MRTLVITSDGMGHLPTRVWEVVRQDQRTIESLAADITMLRFYEGAELLPQTTGIHDMPSTVNTYEVLD